MIVSEKFLDQMKDGFYAAFYKWGPWTDSNNPGLEEVFEMGARILSEKRGPHKVKPNTVSHLTQTKTELCANVHPDLKTEQLREKHWIWMYCANQGRLANIIAIHLAM